MGTIHKGHHALLMMLALTALVLSGTLTSCSSWREAIYFQDLDQAMLENKQKETWVSIKPGDRLTIMVFGPDKYLVMPYNQTLNSVSEGEMGSGGSRDTQLPYDVDNDGYIKFPVLGKIKVSGLTTEDLKNKLHSYLDKDIKDMTLFVAIENFRINVLGEVNKPGKFEIRNNSCTFLEAIALAGDLKLTANRKQVCLLRTEEGELKHYYFDLTKSDLLNSKQYYLQQNDLIYVPPTATQARQSRSDKNQRSIIISACTMLMSAISIAVSALK